MDEMTESTTSQHYNIDSGLGLVEGKDLKR